MVRLLLASSLCLWPTLCATGLLGHRINCPPQQPTPTGDKMALWSLSLYRKSQVLLNRTEPETCHLRKFRVPQINELMGQLQCFLKLGLSDPSPAVLSGGLHPRPSFTQRDKSDVDSYHQPLHTGELGPEDPGR